MTDAKPLFIDTNALVYASVKESPLHHPAIQALQLAHNRQRPLWISRQVLREYLVTMTRPQTFDTLPREVVLEQLAFFVQRFQVADDTPEVTQQLLDIVQRYAIGGKQIHDANIIATMSAYNISCVLTHNKKDFARFTEITVEEIS